ncbi:YgaP family membrane protein [Metabacillus sp. 84]|uniref:YgaP family membrane protein n=1 Tax=unclassified Metabacillus TaxID=2675274 RepID=UPI003CEAE578
MIRPNIGIVNALVRITVGLTLVAIASAKFSKKPWRESLILLIMLGAMKVGEGILRFCPLTLLYDQAKENTSSQDGEADTYNPS